MCALTYYNLICRFVSHTCQVPPPPQQLRVDSYSRTHPEHKGNQRPKFGDQNTKCLLSAHKRSNPAEFNRISAGLIVPHTHQPVRHLGHQSVRMAAFASRASRKFPSSSQISHYLNLESGILTREFLTSACVNRMLVSDLTCCQVCVSSWFSAQYGIPAKCACVRQSEPDLTQHFNSHAHNLLFTVHGGIRCTFRRVACRHGRLQV